MEPVTESDSKFWSKLSNQNITGTTTSKLLGQIDNAREDLI